MDPHGLSDDFLPAELVKRRSVLSDALKALANEDAPKARTMIAQAERLGTVARQRLRMMQ
jgi:hypothetical protein